jgi:ATP phosphoribosyltransferase regulatory subunit
VRPLLIEETARRRRVESRVTAVLEQEGFAEVLLPIIDYAEPYSAAGELDPRQTYRFVDRDGELVAIRADFTPLVARALAPSLTGDQLPLRVFYRGDVIRYEPSRLGSNRELFQIGAEIIGDDSVAADIAALRLAAAIVREIGVRPLIVYSDATIPERLGDRGGEIRAALAEKRPSPIASPLARALTAGTATLEMLRGVMPDVAGRLEAVAAARIADCALHLDDVDRARGYYTGLRFRVYDADARGVVVAQGGRYDSLYGRFGQPAPAIGLTITIDDAR